MSEKKLTATAPATERIGRRGKTVTDTATVKEEGEEEVVVTATSSAVVESPKRRKVEAVESEPAPSAVSTPPQKTPPRNEKKDSAAAEARLRFRYGQSIACSEEEEGDGYKSADQEACCFKSDSNLSQIDNASSPESEVCLGLLMKEMESKSTGCTRSISVVYEAPSSEEIEEFFLSSEKIEAQRFKEKYNYDIVNDMPLEGRLKWERVKP